MVVSKFGVVVDQTLISWDQFFEVMKLMANNKVIEESRKKLIDLVEFSEMQFNQEMDQVRLNRIAQDLGLKPTKTIKGTKNRIVEFFVKCDHNNDLQIYRI